MPNTPGEILQYAPDIITMQEVDHFDDYFFPELNMLGYVGLFAPKPLSACLVVSNSSDGCAIFVNENRLRLISSESITLALTKAELKYVLTFTYVYLHTAVPDSLMACRDGGELNEEDIYIRAQNQVALIAICELLPPRQDSSLRLMDPQVSSSENSSCHLLCKGYRKQCILLSHSVACGVAAIAHTTSLLSDPGHAPNPPHQQIIIIATTHLKSSKSATGERYRQKEIMEVMRRIDQIQESFRVRNREPVVVLAGSFNAVPGTPLPIPHDLPHGSSAHLA